MKPFCLPLLLLLLSCITLHAQDVFEMRSKTKGLSAGVHVGFLSYTDDKIHAETETGLGYGLQVQYGFTHQFTATLSFQHYGVSPKSFNSLELYYGEKYPYTEFDLLGKFIFGATDSKLRPNVTLGLNHTRSDETFYDEFGNTSLEKYGGYSFCGGGGLCYFVNPNMSIDLSLLFNSGSYTTTLVNGQEIDFNHAFFSFKGLLGYSYHF